MSQTRARTPHEHRARPRGSGMHQGAGSRRETFGCKFGKHRGQGPRNRFRSAAGATSRKQHTSTVVIRNRRHTADSIFTGALRTATRAAQWWAGSCLFPPSLCRAWGVDAVDGPGLGCGGCCAVARNGRAPPSSAPSAAMAARRARASRSCSTKVVREGVYGVEEELSACEDDSIVWAESQARFPPAAASRLPLSALTAAVERARVHLWRLRAAASAERGAKGVCRLDPPRRWA